MKKDVTTYDLLFEVTDVLGKKIRTTKGYWQKIKETKHRELRYGSTEVKHTLTNPDEVQRTVADPTIFLYTKTMTNRDILVVAVKILNSEGFIVTVYQTKKHKRKGEILWPKQNDQ